MNSVETGQQLNLSLSSATAQRGTFSCPLSECKRSGCDALTCSCRSCDCGACQQRHKKNMDRGTFAIQTIDICDVCNWPVVPGDLYLEEDPVLRHARCEVLSG